MYQVSLEFQGQRIKTFSITKPAITVGRELDCDIPIDNLGISRRHCKIEEVSGVHVLADLGSNNGTFIKGERVTRHNLNHGDEIIIGKYSLIYENPQQAMAEAQAPQLTDMPTVEIGAEAPAEAEKEGGITMAMGAADAERFAKQRASAVAAYLMIDDKPYILQKAFYTFGKKSDTDFPVSGFFVKSIESIIIREETGYTLIPVGGKTYINTEKKQQQYKLGNADIMKVGSKEFTYFLGKPK
ncbi:MAG: FHA domain-containing protein [Planctomycetota bacterium]|jgi:pSer/pThr/pTyr-binding forkhead associated (FHA) protein